MRVRYWFVSSGPAPCIDRRQSKPGGFEVRALPLRFSKAAIEPIGSRLGHYQIHRFPPASDEELSIGTKPAPTWACRVRSSSLPSVRRNEATGPRIRWISLNRRSCWSEEGTRCSRPNHVAAESDPDPVQHWGKSARITSTLVSRSRLLGAAARAHRPPRR
jgi:hypothetical protein